jgi:hypothetical protein
LWKKGLTYANKERTHPENPYCSASPSTDGEIVAAAYGSAGIAAYDLDGKQLWHRDLGAIDHVWGNSTSPVIHGDLVIHYHGPGENAVLYGLDRKTGKTVWQWQEPRWKPGKRTDGFKGREDKGIIGSFSTPIIVPTGEREELVMSFPMEMKAFDPPPARSSGPAPASTRWSTPHPPTAPASSSPWAATRATRSASRPAARATSPKATGSGNSSSTTAASAPACSRTDTTTTRTPAAPPTASTF